MTPQRVTYERCAVCRRVLLWVAGELRCAVTDGPENDASRAEYPARRPNGPANAKEAAGG
jgi:hypothetical protein